MKLVAIFIKRTRVSTTKHKDGTVSLITLVFISFITSSNSIAVSVESKEMITLAVYHVIKLAANNM